MNGTLFIYKCHCFYNVLSRQVWSLQILKWRDMWPSMVTHTLNLCSAFNPSYVHTYSSEHPHTAVNTHPEQWTAIYAAAPREQLGVRCPWHLSRGIEGGVEIALVIHSPHLQSLPDLRLEPATLGYESDSLKVRPRLPTIKAGMVNLLWTVNLLFNFRINRFSYFFFVFLHLADDFIQSNLHSI